MRLASVDTLNVKGWWWGPWNSHLPVAVGYATAGVDEPHVHRQMVEIYLVAQGTSQIRVEHDTITLQAGDVLVVEPGEAHTFLASSASYLHFVLHAPVESGEVAHADKIAVPRERLGL